MKVSTPLVYQLQADAVNSNIEVSDLLRKTLMLASKLSLEDLKKWVKFELNGYVTEDTVPEYRLVRGQVKVWNPFQGRYMPVTIEDEEWNNELVLRKVGQSIGELQHLLNGDSDVLAVPYPANVQIMLMKQIGTDLPPSLVVTKNQVFKIIDSVKNTILEWSLDLEAQGILGDGLTFSQEEKTMAEKVTYNINTFNGVIGDVSSDKFQLGNKNKILEELDKTGISRPEIEKLEKILAKLENSNSNNKYNVVQEGVSWLTKNASSIGSLSKTIKTWFTDENEKNKL